MLVITQTGIGLGPLRTLHNRATIALTMNVQEFPFFTVTMIAVAAHLVCAFAAVWTERIFNRGGWMREFWEPAQIGRLFSVRQSELRFSFSWKLIILARVALVTAIASFILDLFINA